TFDDKDPDYFHHEVKLMDTRTKEVFYDKLTFIYLEMPKFTKTEDQLVTMFDKWLYAIRHLATLLNRPKALYEKVFEQLFTAAEIAKFNPEELMEYEDSLKALRDWYSVLSTAENKGFAQGKEEGRKEGIEEGMAKGIEEGMAKGIEEGMAKGREEGMAKGREEGEKNKALAIAKQMLADGMPAESVARYTNLTVEEIRRKT
ncbi:MAG TPA: PD-(D/E)XK nuclease family transposase, partial [Candidatus Bacteroides intestinavium]|nr:PD-(D/E)XK nuclease family transposase [Candidatus Bacteroides intestinavium]